MATSDYKIESIQSAPFGEMSYVAWRPGAELALVVDPGFDAAAILDVLGRQGLRLAAILNTHGHADHIAGNAAMKEIFSTVLAYWQEKKVDDAIKLSQDGIKAATELESAAKAQNHPAVVTAQAAIAGASSSGEIGAIGVCAPCHTAHRVRLPDGTFEIK